MILAILFTGIWVIKATGNYVLNNKSLFEEATSSIKTVRHPDNLAAARIGDISLTISELEFRKGLSAASNPAKGTLHTVFNELLEEKYFSTKLYKKSLPLRQKKLKFFWSKSWKKVKQIPNI